MKNNVHEPSLGPSSQPPRAVVASSSASSPGTIRLLQPGGGRGAPPTVTVQPAAGNGGQHPRAHIQPGQSLLIMSEPAKKKFKQ